MRIITWNCQGAFRKKARFIANLKPDIAVIQECEKLEKLNLEKETVQPYSQHWFGDGRKGLGIFSFTDYTIHLNSEYDSSIRHCIPVHVTGKRNFNLIAVWAMNHRKRRLSYIAQVYLGIEKYRNFIKESDTLVIGDFNFNKIWDDTPRIANFSKVVDELEKDGISSIYHEYFREPYGKESKNTLYMYRKQNKGFHIDYCFAPKSWFPFLKCVQIGQYDFWCKLSDHCPLIIDFDEKRRNVS